MPIPINVVPTRSPPKVNHRWMLALAQQWMCQKFGDFYNEFGNAAIRGTWALPKNGEPQAIG
jgi:hypothetical protein